MMNGKLVLMAYGQGVNGPVWRSVTLHDLMNEDGVVFSSGKCFPIGHGFTGLIETF